MASFFRRRQSLATITAIVPDSLEVELTREVPPELEQAALMYFVDILLAALPRKDATAARRELKELAGAVYDALGEAAPSDWRAPIAARREALAAARGAQRGVEFRIKATLHTQRGIPYMEVHFHDHNDPNYVGKVRLCLSRVVVDYLEALDTEAARDCAMTFLMQLDYYIRYALPSRETLGKAPAYAIVDMPARLVS